MSESFPAAAIRRVTATKISDLKTTQTEQGLESHQKTASDVTTTELKDIFPEIMQARASDLQRRIEQASESRGLALGVIGLSVVIVGGAAVAAIVTTFSAGLASVIGVGAGILAAGAAIEGIVYRTSQSSLRELRDQEKEAFRELAEYHRARSLALARQVNPDMASGPAPDASITETFRTEATTKAAPATGGQPAASKAAAAKTGVAPGS